MKTKIVYLAVALALVFSLAAVIVPAGPVEAGTTYYVATTGDDVTGNGSVGKPWATIQHAIDTVSGGDTINVAAGTYAPFTVDGKTDLTIEAVGTVTVQGVQSVATAYGARDCVVFVNDSTLIVLDGLNIQGSGLGDATKDYGVIYENSSGTIRDCTVSTNNIGDMNSIAIGIWDDSNVVIDPCTIENFGRIGVFIYNGCTVSVLDSTIIGQVYSGEGEVCYGIEVEGAWMDDAPATASQVTIRGNEIYNCDNTYSPSPSWESGGIYINGWLEHFAAADSTVLITDNDIHDNYIGIIAIKSPSSYAHDNNIYDNRVYGVISAAAHDASTAVFDAESNWWGATDGPSGVGPGSGDSVSANVDYTPWLVGGTTATGTGTATFGSSAGTIGNFIAVPEGTLPAAAQATKPINFPDGLFSFDITGVGAGGTAIVTITLPPGATPTQYWKYHPITQGGWIQIPMTIVGPPNVIRITLVDGGLGDDDGVADGTIVDQGGPGNLAGCFIATAAYGTSTTEELDTLRAFRDEVLLQNSLGSQLVALYYQTSPPLADFIAEDEVLRTLVRELLVDPVVWVVKAVAPLW